jgi:hypothetical protein
VELELRLRMRVMALSDERPMIYQLLGCSPPFLWFRHDILMVQPEQIGLAALMECPYIG